MANKYIIINPFIQLTILYLLTAFIIFPVELSANQLQLLDITQTPAGTIRSSSPASWEVSVINTNDGEDSPSSIRVGYRVIINDTFSIRADSGEISASGCIVDPSDPEWFLCNEIAEGQSLSTIITWNNVNLGSGDHIIMIQGRCELISPPAGTISLLYTYYCT